MDVLRQEIIEAQKVRSDLLKWKLIIVAALGAVGLGLGEASTIPHAKLVIALVPLVAVYTDLLCYHLNLRMFVIHHYFSLARRRGQATMIDAYEAFAARARCLRRQRRGDSAFDLEEMSIDGLSYLLCIPKVRREKRQSSRASRSRGASAFDLEDLAIDGSTYLLCLLVLGFGTGRELELLGLLWEPQARWYIGAGLAGLVLKILIGLQYRRRSDGLAALVEAEVGRQGL